LKGEAALAEASVGAPLPFPPRKIVTLAYGAAQPARDASLHRPS
jgi:hypothetical protein